MSRKSESIALTVLERFADTDAVHVHGRERQPVPRPARPGLLASRLTASSESLKNREHRLYHVVPPSVTAMPLDDVVSFTAFFAWLDYGGGAAANDVYAVIANGATTDFRGVSACVSYRMGYEM